MRLLVISNGHGEDLIGTRLARGLKAALGDLELEPFPLVGTGTAYAAAGLPVTGPRKALPSGGLTLHHHRLLLDDLAAGLLPLTLAQVRHLRASRPDAVLVVGDAYAQAMAALVRAPRRVLQPLVSVHQSYELSGRPVSGTRWHRTFMERIRAPERWLMSHADRVYTRDHETALALRARGVTQALSLGNPVMDGLDSPPLASLPLADGGGLLVGLLPGSRGYAQRSLALMAAALRALAAPAGATSGAPAPAAAKGPAVAGLVAWAGGEPPPPPAGWEPLAPPAEPGVVAAWRAAPVAGGGEAVIWIVSGRLPAVLASVGTAAGVVIGTAGTANEQAAGLGLPVVSFAVRPEYSHAFLVNQERLLGGAMRIATASGEAVAAAVRAAGPRTPHRELAAEQGPRRMGPPGGTAALVADLVAWLEGLRLGQ